VYDVKTVDVIVLGLQSTCYQYHPRTVVDTECPSSCSQSLIPIKLGTPFKLGIPFELGIESRPWMLLAPGVPVTLGLAFRRLPLRSAIAFCLRLDDSQMCSGHFSYAVTLFHLVNAMMLPALVHFDKTISC